jgi:hypothetical protein
MGLCARWTNHGTHHQMVKPIARMVKPISKWLNQFYPSRRQAPCVRIPVVLLPTTRMNAGGVGLIAIADSVAESASAIFNR